MHFKPYGLSFRGKSAVFPLTLGRAALCCRLRVSPFSKLKRSNAYASFWGEKPASEEIHVARHSPASQRISPGRPALRAHFFGDGCRRKNREVPAPLILPDKARWGGVGGWGRGTPPALAEGFPSPNSSRHFSLARRYCSACWQWRRSPSFSFLARWLRALT